MGQVLGRRVLKGFIVIFLYLLGLDACAQPLSRSEVKSVEDMFKADIGIVNHTERYIYSTNVNGVGGGHAHKMSAGIGNLCCVKLTMKWHSGLLVDVRWDMPEETKHI